MSTLPAPLQEFLELYCNVNALEMLDHLRVHIRTGAVPPNQVAAWRSALDEAAASQSVSPAEFKALTGDNEYLTHEEVADRLRELGAQAFGVSADEAA